jgi:hypothetical protein
MLRGITGALGLVVVLAMIAPTCAVDLPQTAATPTIRFASGARSSGWIPFEFFAGNRIFIPALINGRPTSVMLDTAASSTVLDKRFASSLGLTGGLGTEGAASYSQLHGVTLTLGHAAVANNAAVALDLGPVKKQLGHPLSAALGGEAFRDLVVDIDLKLHRIAFRNPIGYRPPGDAQSVPLLTAGEIARSWRPLKGRRKLLSPSIDHMNPREPE